MTDRTPTPVEIAVARTRDAVLRADARALAALADAFAGAIDLLVADAERVAASLLADIATGTVSVSNAARLQRTTVLLQRVEAELARMVPATARAILSAQVEAGLVAVQHAATLTTVAVGGGSTVGLSVAVVPRAAVIDLIGALDYQTPLGKALASLGRAGAEAVRVEMTTGLVAGRAPGVVAASIRTQLASLLGGVGGDGVPRLGWLQQVARTSMLGAYRSSLIETYAANPGLVRGWRWSAALQGRRTPCPSCIAKHGQVFPLSEPFRSHRACFPAGTAVSGPRALASSARWYQGKMLDIRFASGNLLSVTPNHPILTPEGWVAAGALYQGSHVVCGRGRQGEMLGIDPDYDQAPSLIEDVASSVGSASPVESVSVPTAPEDFHGDGVGSDVAVIRANGHLGDDLDSAILKHLNELPFGIGGARVTILASSGRPASLFEGGDPSARGIVRGGGQALTFGGGALSHSKAVAFRSSSGGHSGLDQEPIDRGTLDAGLLAELLRGNAGLIAGNQGFRGDPLFGEGAMSSSPTGRGRGGVTITKYSPRLQGAAEGVFAQPTDGRENVADGFPVDVSIDCVLDVSVRAFDGHVYNLQTVNGWYSANGIIVHNCRCSAVPALIRPVGRVPIDGEGWLRGQSRETQAAVLGVEGAERWRAGDFALRHLLEGRDDPLFGPYQGHGSIGRAVARASRERRVAA